MSVKVKICGVKSVEIAKAVEKNGGDFIGFIFFEKSPRNVSIEKAVEISASVPNIKKVAVVVDASDEFLQNIKEKLNPDFLQLHGSEFPERVQEIKEKYQIPIIKSVSIKTEEDLPKAEYYKNIADYILFDAKPPAGSNLPGGNALAFDWSMLQKFNPAYNWILSGGLNAENIEDAISRTSCNFIDLSSGVESKKGVKESHLIENLIKRVKKISD